MQFQQIRKFSNSLERERHIAPLVVLRIAFGAVMFVSTVRFMLKGWVTEFYVKPVFHFTFYGFEWVKPLNETGLYFVYTLMALSCLCIMLGCFYRIASITFLILFLYCELLDKTYYLNHYYLVSLIAFLLTLVPAHRDFSVDAWRNSSIRVTQVPAWTISIFKIQLLIVYFYAGISKINYDWLIEALPLKIWLPAKERIPVVGSLFSYEWVAYFFSWFGAVFDLSIGFLLLNNRTRGLAYFFVIAFHLLTALLFKIGMFPFIMIALTLIFFSEDFHIKIINSLSTLFHFKTADSLQSDSSIRISKTLLPVLVIYFGLQLTIPFRHLFYPGDLFWTEEGYRFSWRVMLIEKSGTAFFYVEDANTHHKIEVMNSRYLSSYQEKMMTTQPDMILQYAHFLKNESEASGVKDPIVTVQSYVTLNGHGSRLFIDSSANLSKAKESFCHKSWILEQDQTGDRK
ncbi:type I deoxyribonuclease HsdR [Cytophagales bacterium WSM2-2]|nr:type I deoxyribonuclease HsdR [Cytophagales bacterium WSM2-2]